MRARSIALTVSLLVLIAAAPAQARHTYAGTATATGMELTLAGNGLVIGFSEAAVQSGPSPDGCEGDLRACASAAGELTLGDTAVAWAPGNEGPNDATAFPLPGEFSPLLSGGFGRATAQASATADTTSARGDGGAATIEVTATQSLTENIPLQDVIQTISDEILGPIAEADPTGEIGSRLKATVDQLNENLSATPLLSVSVGPSFSDVLDVDGVTTATAGTRGATIVLSPTPQNLPGAPEGLVIIEVGAARATATTDQFTASASFDPAIVRVKVFNPVTGTYDETPIPQGDSACVPGIEGTPLQICIGAGSGVTTAEGAAAAASAAGVSITAFQDPLPTLRMRFASAEAGVNAAPPAAAPTPTPTAPPPGDPTPDPALPRTGLGVALPALTLLGVGSIAFYGIRRRRDLP